MCRSQVKCLSNVHCVYRSELEFSSQLIVCTLLLLAATQFIPLQSSFYCFGFLFQRNRMLSTFPLKLEMVLSIKQWVLRSGQRKRPLRIHTTTKCISAVNVRVHCCCWCWCCASIHKNRSNNQITTNPIHFYWLRFNSHN